MTLTLTRHHFTVHEYARMREVGLLHEDDRVELLDGEIYAISPIGPLHVGIVNKLNKLLTQMVGDTAIISIQNPIRLNDASEPQPDIAILVPRDDFYSHGLATPDDVFVVIEIADSSLEYDREEKLPRYAQAGISEVWIVDVQKLLVEQYTQPVHNDYTQLQKVLFGYPIRVTRLPAIQFTTDHMF